MSDYLDDEATNQTVFRELNEWTVEMLMATDDDVTHVFLCECSDARCTWPIALSHEEYDAVRAEPTRFVIALNHENPELDCVVSENARFATVRKYGRAVKIAQSTDPRR